MKTTIIYLGVFALTVFTNCNAENVVNKELFNQKQQITNLFLVNGENENLVATTEDTKVALLKDTNLTEDVTTSNLTTTYAKPIEQVIAEDNLITEAPEDEVEVAAFDQSVLKVIAEDNKIIESTKADEFNPLDFKFINQNIMPKVGIINLEKSDIKY
jgi:hypothetical protein